MAPGLPAAWPSRCAVCLLAAAGAALGPSAGSAHGSSAPDGPPSVTATAPGTSGRTATASAAPSSPPPAPSGSASPSALPSALPLPSGVPASGAPGTGPAPSSPVATGSGAQPPGGAGSGPGADAPEPSSSSSASPDVSGSTAPLAGREAGAGKARPGRSLSPMELARAGDPVEEEPPKETDQGIADPVDLPASTPPPDAFSDPGQRSGQALDAAAVRRVQQVSLGTGIALVGLGLGFLAFRMRRAN
ncbi:hypothetical protein [Streptomyces globisporus]|uniref:hypothetical protein n=1 Tax=Streptomyces globisporus TaxID=1908 RepID=UPI0004C619A7|nr:hypothetical protein [Streptomyces globisporus]